MMWRKEKEDMQNKFHNELNKVNTEKENVRANLQRELEQVKYNLH